MAVVDDERRTRPDKVTLDRGFVAEQAKEALDTFVDPLRVVATAALIVASRPFLGPKFIPGRHALARQLVQFKKRSKGRPPKS